MAKMFLGNCCSTWFYKKLVKLFMLFNEMSDENTVVDFQLTAVAVLIYTGFFSL